VAATDLVRTHEEVSKRRHDSSVTAWLNIIYGRLERCAHCVVSHVREVERSSSMDAVRAELVSSAE
jgi:tRNA-2-methylthio-N6-dimethylallyladenosine synthase